ncbi:hypothetical protein [Afifella pfennigii]|uniref:hypothetical protein n=1 Tax=Afifella pfennigii TaxID=209897 RepID=UPI00047ECECD|nr:hypothetical protein [Afifella pfennigii]
MSADVLAGIVLGHNAFFGVDHLSSQRGMERAAHFADPSAILAVVREAHAAGAGGMMMSTHERAAPLSAAIAADPRLRQDLRIYPLLPYAQKYVTRANEVGMVNVVLEMLSGTTLSQKLKLFAMGSRAFVSKDINATLSALMQLELKPFLPLNMPAVFLHDAFTDLALAFGMPQVFEFYLEEIRKSYSAQGGFATKNLPFLLARFREWGLPPPLVMTHFNKCGYHMNPDRGACEKAVAENDCSLLIMGSLASGYLKPEEAYSYLSTVPNIDGIVVGVSRSEHIAETFSAIDRNMPRIARLAE